MHKKISIVLFFFLLSHKVNSQTVSRTDSLSRLLSDSNLVAQTRNQFAQAEYYRKQPSSTNDQWIAAAAVLIAGLISFAATALLSSNTFRIEREKMQELSKNEHAKNTQAAAAVLIGNVAKGAHSLTWVLWIARNTKQNFTTQLIDDYDKKMNNIYSDIAEAQVKLAAHNKKLFEETENIVDKLYKYDAEFGKLAPNVYDTDKNHQALVDIGNMWQKVYDYSLSIPKELSVKIESILNKS